MNTMRRTRWRVGLGLGLLGPFFLCACGAVDTGVQAIRLNEVLALSETESDWLELYNTSDAEVSLAGLGLRDRNSYWVIEEGTLAANGFVRIFCDDSGVDGKTNFKLSAEGEPLTLVDSDGATLDKVTFPAMKSDVSWGRYPDGTGEWGFLEQSTPASSNTKESPTDASTADGT